MTSKLAVSLFVSSLFFNSTSGVAQSIGEEGIAVTDPMVREKCGSCHASDAAGNMQRISWERATPEGWQAALQRMTLLYDVDLTPVEKAHAIQYLSTRHGLAPEEAKQVAYDAERRIHEETGIPNVVTKACGRCHNLARVLSWRRSADDWRTLSQSHDLRYNASANEETMAYLTKLAPLRTPEWDVWSRRSAGKGWAGRWLVTASAGGRIRYFGEMEIEATGSDEFRTHATLQSVVDGSTVIRHGSGEFYGGYAWRGSSQTDVIGAAPDGLTNEAWEVMTLGMDDASANGRWFWGQYYELGFDIHMQRESTSVTLLGIDPPLLKAGSKSKRVSLFGSDFPKQVAPRDLNFGKGITVRRIVSRSPSEVIAEVDVAPDASPGKRNAVLAGSVRLDALSVYDHLDYIKITPESSMAAFGNETRRPGYQQFGAIGFLNGSDGKRHTEDDVELGPVEVKWSMRIFYESEAAPTGSVGAVSSTGLFVPAAPSPNNNFDVWVVGEAETEKDQEGKPLSGKSYLVVTVPFYVFNGRRYVREFDRWVDDGPAQSAR